MDGAAHSGTSDDASHSGPRPGGLHTFHSLRSHSYRLLWFGTLLSSSGQWIQQVTLGWLAYAMTRSALMLGVVNGLRALPLLFLGPLGGVAADQFDRRRLLLVSQWLLIAIALGFATMVIASLSAMRREGLVLLAAVFCLGVALALIAVSRSFPLTIALLVVVGGAQMTYTATNHTVLQLTTPPEYAAE